MSQATDTATVVALAGSVRVHALAMKTKIDALLAADALLHEPVDGVAQENSGAESEFTSLYSDYETKLSDLVSSISSFNDAKSSLESAAAALITGF